MRRSAIERAALWSAVEIGGRQAAQFLVTIVLARLLSPVEFGTVAITLFFGAFATMVLQTVIATALIRQSASTTAEESTIFWLNLLLSLLVAAVLLFASRWIASGFGLPALQPLMIPVALQIALGSLGTVQGALMTRQMRFKELAVIGLLANIIAGVVGIYLALSGFGVWALATQVTIAVGLNALGCVLRSGWRPTADFRPKAISEQLRFSIWLAMSSLLDLLYLQASTLLIGKFYGPGPLGLYGRAGNVQLFAQNLMQAVIGRVSLPVFAARNDDPEQLRAALLASIRLVMFAYVPAMVGLAVCADEVLLVLFGPQWLAAAPFLVLLCLGGSLYPVQLFNEQLLLAQGRSDMAFRLSASRKVAGIGIVLLGSLAGLVGVVWGQFAAMVIGALLGMAVTGRRAGYGLIAQTREIWKAFAASGLMATALVLIQPRLEVSPVLELALLAATGAMVYGVTSIALRAQAALELLRRVRLPLGNA